MCVCSMIADDFYDRWKDRWPQPGQPQQPYHPWPKDPSPPLVPGGPIKPYEPWDPDLPKQPYSPPSTPKPLPPLPFVPPPHPSDEEIKELRKELELLKSLLRRAKIYDSENGEPDCEADEKVEVIRKLSELADYDMGDAIDEPKEEE